MINWQVRLRSKEFLVSLVALVLVLVNQVASIFGYDISFINGQVTELTETILMILALLGIINDPTTKGLSDSKQALYYTKPKE